MLTGCVQQGRGGKGMKRHVDDIVFPAGKVSLWTPWGVQRVAEPNKVEEKPQPPDLSLGGEADVIDPQVHPEIRGS